MGRPLGSKNRRIVEGCLKCPKCKHWKPVTEFFKQTVKEGSERLPYQGYCKVCSIGAAQAYFDSMSPQAQWVKKVKNRHFLVITDALRLWEEKTAGICRLCGDTAELGADHDERTQPKTLGRGRSMLCCRPWGCNTSLGHELGDARLLRIRAAVIREKGISGSWSRKRVPHYNRPAWLDLAADYIECWQRGEVWAGSTLKELHV